MARALRPSDGEPGINPRPQAREADRPARPARQARFARPFPVGPFPRLPALASAAPSPQLIASPSPSTQPMATAAAANPATHLLLDIEGTTCPVNFVIGTLFPYAASALGGFLERQAGDPPIEVLLEEIREAWSNDSDPDARALRLRQSLDGPVDCVPYIDWLIQQDRKLTALKTLQGKIWNEGYRRGDLVAPLFADVAPALKTLKAQGLTIASYSSGSIQAQHLLYQYSTHGDLRALFSFWFDTTIGGKKDASSYTRICEVMQVEPAHVLFVSDIRAELDAAGEAGLQCRFSRREGNPEASGDPFASLESFDQLPWLA